MTQKISNRIEALKRALKLPVDGPLLTKRDVQEDFQISERQLEILIELGRIAGFKDGKCWKTTPAMRNDYVRQAIAEEIARLESMAE